MNGVDSISARLEKLPYPRRVALFATIIFSVSVGTRYVLQTPPFFGLAPTPVAEAPQPTLPIVVEYRAATIVPGMVLKVTNRSAQPLSVLVKLSGPELESSQRYLLDIKAHSGNTVGSGEALPLVPGDTVQITQNDFQLWEGRIP